MTVQISAAMRNASLDGMFTAVGASPILKLYTGSPPSTLGAAATGNVLIVYPLSTAFGTLGASAGVKDLKTGVIITGAAITPGTVGYFRLYASDGVTAHMQGTVTLAGGGGDMTIDNNVITPGQTVSIVGWTIADGNSS